LQLAIPKCGSILLKGYSSFEDENELIVDDSQLAVLESTRDLGVLVDTKLAFSLQVASNVPQAKQRFFVIFKSFVSRDITPLVYAYKINIV